MKVLLSLALTIMATACLGEIHSLAPARIKRGEWEKWMQSLKVCRGPVQGGPRCCCGANFGAYYYDVESGTCKLNKYGGCSATMNNFYSMEECEKTCLPKTDVCELPLKTGPCKVAPLTRYFFNVDSQECERFTYGGCGGNANNFPSMRDCKERCDSVVRSSSSSSSSSSSESDSESEKLIQIASSNEMPKEKDGVAGKASKLIKKPLSELKALKTRRKFALGQKVEQAEATDAKRKYTFLEECCHEAPCSKEEVVELAALGTDIYREMEKYYWCRP